MIRMLFEYLACVECRHVSKNLSSVWSSGTYVSVLLCDFFGLQWVLDGVHKYIPRLQYVALSCGGRLAVRVLCSKQVSNFFSKLDSGTSGTECNIMINNHSLCNILGSPGSQSSGQDCLLQTESQRCFDLDRWDEFLATSLMEPTPGFHSAP